MTPVHMRRFTFLQSNELISVLTNARQRDNLAIGVRVAFTKKFTLELLLGGGNTVLIDPDELRVSGDGIEPEFNKMRIIDYGQTLALGKYEASIDALLEKLTN